jgi:hypothetical protein
MKTRVIQDEPDERPTPHPSTAPAAGEEPPPDLTGRRRRWSARYWRIALWVTLAALVLGAAYLVTRPGKDAPAASGPGAAPKFSAIERCVRDEMAAQRIPGLALGIVKDNRIGTSYGMGWYVGPINGIPAIYHEGDTFNFLAKAVLVPRSRTG